MHIDDKPAEVEEQQQYACGHEFDELSERRRLLRERRKENFAQCQVLNAKYKPKFDKNRAHKSNSAVT